MIKPFAKTIKYQKNKKINGYLNLLIIKNLFVNF